MEMYLNRLASTHPRDAEPRIAIETLIQIESKKVRVFNVHLGVSINRDATEYSNIQFKYLLRLLGKGENTVLMGDFNNTLENPHMQELERLMVNTDKKQEPTWPYLLASKIEHHEIYGKKIPNETLLTHRIDQIYVGSDIKVKSFTLGDSKASDHRSLTAELEI
jgi:endonuclease/exonuclease/phosphatase family metal-dependent hydrolase